MYKKIVPKKLLRLQMQKKIKHTLIPLITWSDGSEMKEAYPDISIANQFLKPLKNRVRGYSYNASDYVETVVRFLEYIESELGVCFEEEPDQISIEMAQHYLRYYCDTPGKYGDARSKMARNRERAHLSIFLINLRDNCENSCLKDHYIRRGADEKNRRGMSVYDYELICSYSDSKPENEVMRDCRDFFVAEVVRQAWNNNKQVWIVVILMICAGVRASEACNVRIALTKYGKGFRTRYFALGEELMLSGLELNLKKSEEERPLRFDVTGDTRIKKPRIVDVRFPNELKDAIDTYLDLTKDRNRRNTGPLVVNERRDGKTGFHEAMTYDNFRKQIKNLIAMYVIPALQKRGGKYAEYANKLATNSYGPHFFREFFTIQMVKDQEGWAEIMRYRGDSGVDTALTYIQKGDFPELITETSDKLAKILTGDNGEKSKKRKGMQSFPKRT